MIAKGVVFTSDGEGNKYYIPEEKLFIWGELVEDSSRNYEGLDAPEWATPIEGEVYIVDIKERL